LNALQVRQLTLLEQLQVQHLHSYENGLASWLQPVRLLQELHLRDVIS
jgi:hypothetical protein